MPYFSFAREFPDTPMDWKATHRNARPELAVPQKYHLGPSPVYFYHVTMSSLLNDILEKNKFDFLKLSCKITCYQIKHIVVNYKVWSSLYPEKI